VNEAFCAQLGARLGLDVAMGEPRRLGDLEFLLVPRYDRITTPSGVERLHQEDFCQALGIPPNRKYEAEGGPSLAESFTLLRTATTVPAREITRLVDQIALSYLVGNHDAHGKNFSLLYSPEGTRLAPAYDVLSTVAYHATHRLTRRMAMKIGGDYRPGYLHARHWDRTLSDAGLGVAAARRRLKGHATAAPTAAAAVRTEFAEAGWDAPVLDRIETVVADRAGRLLEAVGGVKAG
jgi:serine/threonine-protein kinase HipA